MSTVPATPEQKNRHPFRRAVLRGLALVMPTLLTIVIFLWAWSIIESYVLQPIEKGARHIIVWSIKDVHEVVPEGKVHIDQKDERVEGFTFQGQKYVRFDPQQAKWIPLLVRETVNASPSESPPTTAEAYYQRYVEVRYLKRKYVLPFFLCLFILALYFLGKFLAAGMGRMLWNFGEGFIHRLPIIRTVYSSAKQVSDFVFSERDIEYTRVVAVEYPRKGIWSIGFVTGESMGDLRRVANEPVVSVLMPTSPMPATGFTVTVPKRETVDLDITIDQAIQFVVSCGVVVPLHQQQENDKVTLAIAEAIAEQPGNGSPQPALATTESNEPHDDQA